MKAMKVTLAIAAVAILSSTANADLLITEVVDAGLAGGNPKFVEITNTGADFTFTAGGIIVQSNAATDRTVDVDMTGITILAGQSYVIQSSANDGQAQFELEYGFPADLYTTAFFSNGDDRYILTDTADGSNLLDIHGDIDIDGTFTTWEYLDSYAYRIFGSSSNGGVFVQAEWFQAPVNYFDAPNNVVGAASAVTDPGVWVPEPSTLALLGFGGLALIRRRR